MAIFRHLSEAGAQCGSPARWDLCGGQAESQDEGLSLPRPQFRRNYSTRTPPNAIRPAPAGS